MLKKLIDNKKLISEWNYIKNNNIDLITLTVGSGKKVWWKCSKGHEWEARVSSRNNGSGCPYCSGRNAISGVNDLVTLFPEIAKEWDYTKNKKNNPKSMTTSSNQKIWWICSKGHSYECTIQHRTNGDNCPYCSNHQVLVGYNDLATTNPEIIKEWNYEKNEQIMPTMVTSGSGKKVWWKCPNGHEWIAPVYSRSKGNGCPICSNKKIQVGINDLSTTNPDLAKEWNYEKNVNIKITEVTANSKAKVWWMCPKGHEWETTVEHRNRGRGCPICNNERQSSFPEQAIYYYLSKTFSSTTNRFKLEDKYELDIYIPEKNIAIEYDGIFFHSLPKTKEREDRKNKACSNNKILLIRIKESNEVDDVNIININDFLINILYSPEKEYANLEKTIKTLFLLLKKRGLLLDEDVDLNRDKNKILELLKLTSYKDNLSEIFPNVANEWHSTKNGKLTPSSFAYASNYKVWWICPNGHEYESKISNRTILKRGCPYCSNQKLLTGYNDLFTTNPDLAKEWNYEKNVDLKPTDVMKGTAKKVWWKCSKGHEWEATINSRDNGNGCPYCSGHNVSKGENDLETIHPNLIQQWDYDKNKEKKPFDYKHNSSYAVWWKCKKGHSYKMSITKKIDGEQCPYCSNKIALLEYNDLFTTNPELKEQWDYEKNKLINPLLLLKNSSKKVWWTCSNSHHYERRVFEKINGNDCPYCIGTKVLSGYNDLITLHPNIAKEWNYDKNMPIDPTTLSDGSEKNVWWKCSKGHEWQATICSRVQGVACPYCTNRKILSGYNDLATLNPVLIKEWDYDKNKTIDPSKVGTKSMSKVWWKCSSCGNEWKTSIYNRNRGAGCNICKSKRVKTGLNDLSTTDPKLASEWNYIKNKNVNIKEITRNSKLSVWWKCTNGHEWEATIYSRAQGGICPYCANNKVLSGYNDLATLHPEVVKSWDYKKNNILPTELLVTSREKVWWNCPKGHSYICTIKSRLHPKHQCQICANRQVLVGYNDLCTTNPELSKEWNYDKNKEINPLDVVKGSPKKVWWKCSKGHEWFAEIRKRTIDKTGCPVCIKINKKR